MLALEWNLNDALQARFEEGYEDGHNKGINAGIESVALNMLRSGMTVETIQEFTRLSFERIKELEAKEATAKKENADE